MTALAGIWRFDGQPTAAADVDGMLSAQSIYGPHHSASWSDVSIGLGRQLFRTLPEDVHDRGPMIGADGTSILVADVRLDNREALVGELDLSPDQSRVLCDAAIVLAGFERWNEAVVDHLVGDFALAIWDRRGQRLILARDCLGQRPLHYHRGANFFAFASMPKGLHALPDVPYAPDEERAVEFMALTPEIGSRTFFAGIDQVETGCIVTVTAQGVSSRRYWNPSRQRLALSNADDYVEGLRHHLDEAVRARLRGAGANVGAHLSGGLDSASVAATAARLLAQSGGRVTAFTSVPRRGYDGPSPNGRIGDEGPLAAATAAMYPNMEHVLIRTSGQSPLDTLDRDFHLFEKPMLNLCNNMWLRTINDQARARKLSVLLSGQMGNMSISYAGFELLAELFTSGRWRALLIEALALKRSGEMRWRRVASSIAGPFLPPPLWRWLSKTFRGSNLDFAQYGAINPQRLSALNLVRERDPALSYRPWRDGVAMRLWAMRRVDMGNINKGVLAGWGIDQRDPTADKRLIEFCLSTPTEHFLSKGVPRSLAKRALVDRLPLEVLNEPRRGIQAVDWHEGVNAARADIVTEMERLSACAVAATTLDLPKMQAFVEDWPTAGWEQPAIVQSYRMLLLRGLSMGHFLRKAVGSNQ